MNLYSYVRIPLQVQTILITFRILVNNSESIITDIHYEVEHRLLNNIHVCHDLLTEWEYVHQVKTNLATVAISIICFRIKRTLITFSSDKRRFMVGYI